MLKPANLFLYSMLLFVSCARLRHTGLESRCQHTLKIMEQGTLHTQMASIPAGIFYHINQVMEDSVCFSERDAPFQKSDRKNNYIPNCSRRLIAAYQWNHEWVLVYERGGISYRCLAAWFCLKNGKVRQSCSITLKYAQLPADYHNLQLIRQLLAQNSCFLLYDQSRQLRRTAYF